VVRSATDEPFRSFGQGSTGAGQVGQSADGDGYAHDSPKRSATDGPSPVPVGLLRSARNPGLELGFERFIAARALTVAFDLIARCVVARSGIVGRNFGHRVDRFAIEGALRPASIGTG